MQVKRLYYLLTFSVAVNVLFGAAFFYFLMRELPPQPYFDSKPAENAERLPLIAMERSNMELLYYLRTLPFEYLVAKLNDKHLVENGYALRDLALATLTNFHHFDLERALNNKTLQKRTLHFGKTRSGIDFDLSIYPGLTDQEYESIIQFAKSEKWPLNARGLYRLLRKKKDAFEPSIAETFFLTPEFLYTEALFLHSGVTIKRAELLRILCEGNWNMLKTFADQQRECQDLSPNRRQSFLIDYIMHNSSTAAIFMLNTDFDFAEKKLDDATIAKILDLLNVKNTVTERFINTIASSPRSDNVQRKAQTLLGKKQTTQAKSSPSKKSISHKVQEGDSLWKIAKKYKTNTQTLKKLNNLQSDTLKPGITLLIP